MSYNRQQLSALYAGLGYYKPHAVVIGGAAMVFHGLLDEAKDLDVALPEHIMNFHAAEADVNVGDAGLMRNEGDFVPARYWPSGQNGIDFCSGGSAYATNPAEIIEFGGVKVLARPALLCFYQNLNRPKDQEKIALLVQVLAHLEDVRLAMFRDSDPDERTVLMTMAALGTRGGPRVFAASPREAYEFYDRNVGSIARR